MSREDPGSLGTNPGLIYVKCCKTTPQIPLFVTNKSTDGRVPAEGLTTEGREDRVWTTCGSRHVRTVCRYFVLRVITASKSSTRFGLSSTSDVVPTLFCVTSPPYVYTCHHHGLSPTSAPEVCVSLRPFTLPLGQDDVSVPTPLHLALISRNQCSLC